MGFKELPDAKKVCCEDKSEKRTFWFRSRKNPLCFRAEGGRFFRSRSNCRSPFENILKGHTAIPNGSGFEPAI